MTAAKHIGTAKARSTENLDQRRNMTMTLTVSSNNHAPNQSVVVDPMPTAIAPANLLTINASHTADAGAESDKCKPTQQK